MSTRPRRHPWFREPDPIAQADEKAAWERITIAALDRYEAYDRRKLAEVFEPFAYEDGITQADVDAWLNRKM